MRWLGVATPSFHLRQFKALGTARRQLGAEHEPLRVFAVEHRRERIRAILQTHPQGSLRSRQFYSLGAALSQQSAEAHAECFCVFGLVSNHCTAPIQHTAYSSKVP
jgi:hypothetical protein